MKTKLKLTIALGFIITLCVGYLIGILVNFPPVSKSDLAGTFGKAEKFHKVQMTEKDIQLRSELVKDTAKLKSMIQGLVYFSMVTEEVSTNVDLSIITFKAKGMGTQAGEAENIKALQDYSEFIRNNNNSLKATIAMLSDFYLNKSADQTQDVEKNLKDFGNYVNTLNKKNTILNRALKSLDNFMLASKTLQAHKKEIAQLKSIRDQLLVKGVQLGSLFGNVHQVDSLIAYALTSNAQLSAACFGAVNVQAVSLANSQSHFLGQQSVSAKVLSGTESGSLGAQGLNSTSSVVYYDKVNLEFKYYGVSGQLDSHSFGNKPSGDFGVVAYSSSGSVIVPCSNYSLDQVLTSQPFGSTSLSGSSTLLQSTGLDNVDHCFSSSVSFNNVFTDLSSQFLNSSLTN